MKRKILTFILPYVAWSYIAFVAATSRYEWVVNSDHQDLLLKKYKNIIYAFWHGRQFFLNWTHRARGTHIVVSQSRDGEYIARTIHLFGNHTLRGSSSRGAQRVLVELIRTLRSGFSVAVTPDGPRGPKHEVKVGILYAALKSQKPILSASYSAKRKIIFSGWDDYWIPLPFNQIVCGYGNPVFVNNEQEIPEKALELKRELDNLSAQLDQYFLIKPSSNV